jgi:hypothetical protein
VQEGEVDVDDLRVVFMVLHLRNPSLEAGVVLLTYIVQQQSLEITLGIEDTENGISFEDLGSDEFPDEGFLANAML